MLNKLITKWNQPSNYRILEVSHEMEAGTLYMYEVQRCILGRYVTVDAYNVYALAQMAVDTLRGILIDDIKGKEWVFLFNRDAGSKVIGGVSND